MLNMFDILYTPQKPILRLADLGGPLVYWFELSCGVPGGAPSGKLGLLEVPGCELKAWG